MPKVSVIIPCYNEIKYINQIIDSLINQDFEKSELEVFFIDGGSNDGTLQVLVESEKDNDWIYILNNKNRTVPHALNIGIGNSSGEYIMRMDVHSNFPPNYIKDIIEWHEYLEVDNVGGICLTDVINKNPISEAIRIVMSDKFGVGNSVFRVGAEHLTDVDTVPFGCYKREVFNQIGRFDVRLTRNQDIEFNKRLKRSGGLIYLVPDVFCTYYSRDTFTSLFKNRFKTGLWIVKTSFITQNLGNLSIRHFVPLMFILGLLTPLLFLYFIPYAWILSLLVLILYILVLGRRSIKIKNKSTNVYRVLMAFIVLHFSYGLGSLIGLSKFGLYFGSKKK